MSFFSIGKVAAASSLSTGIALYPNDGQDLDTLLHMADISMYHAKNCGRNTCRFLDKINIEAAGRLPRRHFA